jgi:hypothetical protein
MVRRNAIVVLADTKIKGGAKWNDKNQKHPRNEGIRGMVADRPQARGSWSTQAVLRIWPA